MLVLPCVGLLWLVVGCSSSRGFCEASADCDEEFFGIEVPDAAGSADDDVAVCTAQQDARIAALRANEEDECHAVADALEAFNACVASEFAGGEDGCDAVQEKCDNERDDLQEALSDQDGDECSSRED